MANFRSISTGDVFPQPDLTLSQNQNGGWTGSRSYYMKRDTWNTSTIKSRFARGVSVGTADSTIDSFYSFLTIQSATPQEEEGELVRLTVTYTGAASGQFGGENDADLSLQALPTYRLRGRTRDLPYSDHWKWRELGADQRYALGLLLNGHVIRNPDNTAQVGIQFDSDTFLVTAWDSDDITLEGDALEFAERISEGKSTFKSPTFVWSETTQGNVGLNNNQLNKLAKIATPRGNPPSVSTTDRDWMLTSADQTQQGELITTGLEWELSEQGGHDPFLYQD